MDNSLYLRGPSDLDRFDQLQPKVEDVIGAIEALNGKGNSGVLLKDKDSTKPYLAIAGGDKERYVVFLAVDGAWAKNVVNPQYPKGEMDVRIKCGGQASNMDLHFIVDKASAIVAARYFFAYRKESPDLVWESP